MDDDVSYCKINVTRQDVASAFEVFVPPLFILVALAIALIGLNLSTRRNAERRTRNTTRMATQDPTDDVDTENQDQALTLMSDPDNFYTEFDLEILDRLTYDYNNPRDIVRICVPSICSLLLATVFVLNLDQIASCIWPYRGRPAMNTAITCFLAPIGLVFALSFGFVFQQVLEKHATVYDNVARELSQLDQMLTMTTKFSWPRHAHALTMFKAIKSELVILAAMVLNKEPSDFRATAPSTVKVHIWTVLDVLQKSAEHKESSFNLNGLLVDQLVEYLLQTNSICTDRMGALHTGIHPMKWLFLELQGTIVIFGILLIDTQSPLMEMALLTFIEFSCFMLFYLVADYDSPFNGVFRVTRDIIPEVVERSERLYMSKLCDYRMEAIREEMTDSLQDKEYKTVIKGKRKSRCGLGETSMTLDDDLGCTGITPV